MQLAISILIALIFLILLIKISFITKTHLNVNESNLYSTTIFINNKSFNFVIDTGSSYCVINQSIADILTYEPIDGTTIIATTNGKLNVKFGKFLITYKGYELVITMQIVPDLPEDGLLGMDFLKTFDCIINCQKNVMYGNYNKLKS